MCKVVMAVAKETKGTFQFKEVITGKEPAIIGTLYVPKRTLEIMGFDPAKKQVITIDLGIEEIAAPADQAQAPAQAQEIAPAPTPAKRRGRKAKAAESQEKAPEAKTSPAPAVKKRGGRKAKTA